MTQHEQRSKEALLTIHTRVQAVAQKIERGLDNAVQATLRGDYHLANRVVLGDKPINREIRAIDTECHESVAGHRPSAGHLRYVSSVLRLNVELERIGDYAVTIAREAVQLSTVPSGSVAGDIQLIAGQARQMFGQAMDSFNDQSPELARATKRMARQVDGTYQKVFDDLIQEGEKGARPMRDLFALLVIFNRLRRVGDQAKNICEETVFAVTGETKAEKTYRVLFLDQANDAISQLARAYATKAFPESGQYTCAGWAPARKVLPTLEKFMHAEGLDGDEMTPQKATCTVKELAEFHVVVCLGHGAAEQIEEIPFHTVLLEWEVDPVPFDLDPERATALLESTFAVLKNKIRELMEILRGEESR